MFRQSSSEEQICYCLLLCAVLKTSPSQLHLPVSVIVTKFNRCWKTKEARALFDFFSGAAEKKFSTNEPHQILKTTGNAWCRASTNNSPRDRN